MTRLDLVRNEEIRQRLNQEAVVDTLRRRQRKWKERLESMDENRLARRVYEDEMTGKRPRGRAMEEMD